MRFGCLTAPTAFQTKSEVKKNPPHDRAMFLKHLSNFFIAISGAVMSFGCLAGGSCPGGLDQLVTLESGPSQPQSVSPWPDDRPDAVQSSSSPHPSASPTPTDLSAAHLQVTSSNDHCIPHFGLRCC